MLHLEKVVSFLDTYLDIQSSKTDESWNGLQVEGKSAVKKIMFTTDVGIETIEKAIYYNVDMLVVHHGLLWKSVDPSVKGANKKRIELLLKNGISLYGVHLPLDKHPEVGNNAQLLKILGFKKYKPFALYNGAYISFIGRTNRPKTIIEIENILKKDLGAFCKTLSFGKKKISTMAVCSGGGGYPQLMEALRADVDLYLTGDSTEFYHLVKDYQMNVICAGHHATEIVGVRALAIVVKKELKVDAFFIDFPTGL
ncbi:MAG: Nif3-like dinuclear metal center hexameric protein [Oligoflexia bacterium]|nr:Nif3-like dinuclear metal center hexameric protein [Oligoflexia bacterium]